MTRVGWLTSGAVRAGALALGALLLAATRSDASGIELRLWPSVLRLAAGDTLGVEVMIEASDAAWNGYELVVTYDPELLTLAPLSPTTLQEGDLMTGACPDRWHRFVEETAGHVTLSHALLCPGARVQGAGTLYHLRFTARDASGLAAIRVEDAQFAQAGRDLGPVLVQNATVRVGEGGLLALTWGRLKDLYP